MLTWREIQLARDVVGELRASGADEKAAAVERLVAAAVPMSQVQSEVAPRELFTTGQAARALGVSVQTIKNWANAGQLQAVRLGGRVMIHRDSLLGYLDRLRRNQPANRDHPDSEESAARREYVLAGLPPEKIQRVRVLTNKIEASEPLSETEEDELTRLQDEVAQFSWERLKQWVAWQGAGR